MYTEADFDMTQQAFQQNGYTADDQRLHVKFSMQAHFSPSKSHDAQRPIYEDKEYVTIMVPGDKFNIVNRPVWDMDKQRFPTQYAAFKNGQAQEVIGTPLDTVTFVTAGQRAELAYFGVKTVEQLANMADSNAGKMMGVVGLKRRAIDWLEAAKGNEPMAKMRAELEERDAKLEAQTQALADLTALVKQMQATQSAQTSEKPATVKK